MSLVCGVCVYKYMRAHLCCVCMCFCMRMLYLYVGLFCLSPIAATKYYIYELHAILVYAAVYIRLCIHKFETRMTMRWNKCSGHVVGTRGVVCIFVYAQTPKKKTTAEQWGLLLIFAEGGFLFFFVNNKMVYTFSYCAASVFK